MPIYNTRDLIPFVNNIENMLEDVISSVNEWDQQKFKIINAVDKVDSNHQSAMAALVRADEALAELGNATFKSTERRGKRLQDILNKLRKEMYDIAGSAGGSGSGGTGGGGSLTEGVFFDELNNAIASVDVTIEDGLKLDYRIREIAEIAATGGALSDKQFHMPYKYRVLHPSKTFSIIGEEGIVFVEGEVTALDDLGDPFLGDNNTVITGTITADGVVTLSNVPTTAFNLYFPVRMSFNEIPEEFLYLFMQQVIQKNSHAMEVILNVESTIDDILENIQVMKGVSWTPDYSIMRNHQAIVKEGITPKGLSVEVKEGMANVTFSYNDHPHLSHFVLEKWDEAQKAFVPYDGINGIVQK